MLPNLCFAWIDLFCQDENCFLILITILELANPRTVDSLRGMLLKQESL
jgi:hypothetical protein